MLKRIILLRRKAGLARAEMLHYWQHVHAPLAMQFPEWFESTQRYTQNHLADQLSGDSFDFDGMVESWQRPAADTANSKLRSFPDTEAYRTVVGPDELKFVDRASSLLFFVNEHVLQPRAGAVKVLRFVTRREGISAADFGARWVAMPAAGLAGGLVRNVTVPGSMKVIGAPDAPPPFEVSGIEERRYDSLEAAKAAVAALKDDDASRTLACVVSREVNLYDRNAAVRAPGNS
jgi:hypothetical protein